MTRREEKRREKGRTGEETGRGWEIYRVTPDVARKKEKKKEKHRVTPAAARRFGDGERQGGGGDVYTGAKESEDAKKELGVRIGRVTE